MAACPTRTASQSSPRLSPAPLCLAGDSQIYPCSPATRDAFIELSARHPHADVLWASQTPRARARTPDLPAENHSPPPFPSQQCLLAGARARHRESPPDSSDPACQEVLLALLSSDIQPLSASYRLLGYRLVRAITTPFTWTAATSSFLPVPTGSAPRMDQSDHVTSPHCLRVKGKGSWWRRGPPPHGPTPCSRSLGCFLAHSALATLMSWLVPLPWGLGLAGSLSLAGFPSQISAWSTRSSISVLRHFLNEVPHPTLFTVTTLSPDPISS